MTGRDIGHIKGWVLAHPHQINIFGQIDFFSVFKGDVVAALPPDSHGARPGFYPVFIIS